MFGQRDKRVARRQRALEELLWLDPVERERRIIAAVAAGDFTADEVDASLRLVMRLDMLREMDLPAGGRLIGSVEADHGAGISSDDVELSMVAEAPEADTENEPQEDELIGVPIVVEPVEVGIRPDYVGIPIEPDPTPAPSPESSLEAAMSLDALESAERWEEDNLVAASPVLAKRAAEARGEWDVPVEGAQVSLAEDAPSIAWLRPN